MSKLVLVSHRLPVSLSRSGGKETLKASAGGLVAGLAPVHAQPGATWIGSLGGRVPKSIAAELRRRRLVDVPLPPTMARRHYEGFSNRVLWPLCHYLVGAIDFDPRDYAAYRAANERFADAVAEHADPDTRIWIHDYHLMLLPRLLRERLPEASIGFFLHVPFPSSDVFRVLPVGADLLQGLLGADLVGVHTYGYARHLATSIRRVLGMEVDVHGGTVGERRCRIGVFPLGVDSATLAERAATPAVERHLAEWRRRTQGRRVLLGVDRLDYTKGLVPRLDGYRHLLEEHRRWRDEAVFIQLAVPSRAAIPEYAAVKSEVERRVGEINGRFGRFGQVPLQYFYRSVSPEELSALYRLADVAVVTPIRDGMNLVAKEYAAARVDGTGVLVLSQFAGAASEMGEALLVNPWDVEGMAAAMDRALRMPEEERRARMLALRERLAATDVSSWAARFLAVLAEARAESRRRQPELPTTGWPRRLRAEFAAAARPLLLLDHDGTLREHVADPDAARPEAPVLDLLATLSRRAEVVIVTGRSQGAVDDWLGGVPVHRIAEHGLSLRRRDRSRWEDLAPPFDLAWMPAVRQVMDDFVLRAPGARVEQARASIAWHYRAAGPHSGVRAARELAHHLSEYFANTALQVLHGARVVEARAVGVNPGLAYRELERRLGPFDFVLAAGDDRSDEDLFRALPPTAHAIRVGPGTTSANYRLPGPAALVTLLRELAATAPLARAARAQAAGSSDQEAP